MVGSRGWWGLGVVGVKTVGVGGGGQGVGRWGLGVEVGGWESRSGW